MRQKRPFDRPEAWSKTPIVQTFGVDLIGARRRWSVVWRCRMGTAPPIRALRAGMPVLLPAVLVFLLFLLPGCAGVPQLPAPSDSDVGWVLTGADLLPASSPDTGMEDVQSLLHVSDEMRKFAID